MSTASPRNLSDCGVIAEASLEESRYYLILTQDLGYGETAKLLNSLEEVSRLLNSYSKAILDSSSGS